MLQSTRSQAGFKRAVNSRTAIAASHDIPLTCSGKGLPPRSGSRYRKSSTAFSESLNLRAFATVVAAASENKVHLGLSLSPAESSKGILELFPGDN